MKKLFVILFLLVPLISGAQASKIISSQAVPKNVTAPNLVWVDLGDTLTGGGGQYRLWLAYPDSLKIKPIQMLWLNDSIYSRSDLRYAQLLGAYTNPTFVNSLSAGKIFGLSTVATSGSYADLTGLPNLSLKYDASNPSGYISSINSGMVTAALGFTPYNSSNPSNYITASALSPYYLASNPNGYITSVPAQTFASLTGKPTTISGYGITDATSTVRAAISLTTTGTSGAATYNSSTGLLNVPNYATPSAPTYNNAPSRTLNSAFQISTTKNTRVSYSVTCVTALSLLNLNGTAQAFLEISADGSTNWITLNGAGIARTLSVAITLGLNESSIYNIQGEIPATFYCRIRTSTAGTGSTVTFTSGQEVQY
jgi:hypothetical protein